MTHPDQDDGTRLEQALHAYLAWCRSPQPVSRAAFLEQHAELRDLIEPMLDDDDTPAPTDSRVLGDFRVVREVGRGGMGVVYEAVQRSLGRRVALKVLPAHLTLHETAIARFRREAETAARLEHPGLVRVHTVASTGDVHYFAMDFVAGAPLDAIVRSMADLPPESLTGDTVGMAVEASRHRPLAEPSQDADGQLRGAGFWSRSYVETMVGIVVQVADALEHAHRAQVIHRDVKPSNILVRRDGSAVLTDFGLAREVGLPSVTMTGEFVGTPHYVSPEQAMAGRAVVDRRSDVFSLGATLYELVTLHRAFPGDTPQDVFGAILAREPRNPLKLNRNLAPDLGAVVLKALEKDPERRYQTAAAMAADLRAFLAYRPVTARRISSGRRAARWIRRNPLVSALAGALLLALVVFFVWTVLKNRELRVAVADFRRMSDVLLVTRLAGSFLDLQASRPEHAAALAHWRQQAEALVARRSRHEATLAALRRRGTQAAGDRWTFADATDQWQHDTLVELLDELDRFTEPHGAFATVGRWQRFVAEVEQRSLVDHHDLWQRTIADIGDRASCPQYDGLALRPQMGLVPLGKDPQSGLHEFAHLLSGDLPARGADGRLQITADTAIVLVLLPGGDCDLGSRPVDAGHPVGSPFADPWSSDVEGPVHTVRLAPFLLSKFELTHGQLRRATGLARGAFAARGKVPPGGSLQTLPVETINWIESDQAMRAIGLRLPTEAQWEYAARAGTTTIWYTGDDVASLQGHANYTDRGYMQARGQIEADDPQLWAFDDGFALVACVGSFAPNGFGLHDVLGNVSEWTLDTPVRYSEPARAGDGLRSGGEPDFHMTRGGSFMLRPVEGRSASRTRGDKWTHVTSLGIRPARAID